MDKKTITVALALFLLLAMYLPSASGMYKTVNIPRLDHLIYATFGMPETTDPGWAYDTASAELVWNVYGALYGFDGERIPRVDLATGNIVDVDWDIAEWGKVSSDSLTYTFKIRSGIKWHDSDGPSGMPEPLNYGTVTAEDVEYSIERGMVLDHEGGPYWMLFQPLLGIMTTKQDTAFMAGDNAAATALATRIQNAVTVTHNATGDYVAFHLAAPYEPFVQILAQTWASVLPKQWMKDLYAAGRTTNWPGWDVTGNINWRNFNDRYAPMEKSPLDTPASAMLGSGPYKFQEWATMVRWRVVRFTGYWKGWPAPSAGGFAERVTVENVEDWTTRKAMFIAGDVDIAEVPRAYVSEMDPAPPGIRGQKDWPSLTIGNLLFNYNVSTRSSWVPKLGGIDKPNLLSDIHMRKALAQCLDFVTYFATAWKNEAKQPRGIIIEGLKGYWPEAPIYSYDLEAAKAHFQQAWGGQAWSQGFELYLLYNTGNEQRRILCEMVEAAVETKITDWGTLPNIIPLAQTWSIIIPALYNYELPGFNIGWLADFAHAHNFATPFIHTLGDYALFQSVQYGQQAIIKQKAMFDGVEGELVNNAYVNHMVEKAVSLKFTGTGGADDAQMWYNELQRIFYEEIPTLPAYHILDRHFERTWVQGIYYNTLGMRSLGYYYYHLFKGLDAEISGDHRVDIADASKISAHFYTPYLSGPLGYNRKADIKPVNEQNGTAYTIYGADGWVDIEDAALVNSQWMDEAIPV